MTQESKTYSFAKENLDAFLTKLAKVNRRAVKLNLPEISCDILREWEQWHEDTRSLDGGYSVTTVTVQLTGDAPKLKGYSLVASLEAVEDMETLREIDNTLLETAGNIIRKVPSMKEELPEVYRTRRSCDHCHTNRNRKYTVILKHLETGQLIQVGKTCLKDFLGWDLPGNPDFYFNALEGLEDVLDSYGMGGRPSTYVDIFLGHVAASIERFGWVSKTVAYQEARQSTSEAALDSMFAKKAEDRLEVTEAYKLLVKDVIAWGVSLQERDDLNDYLHTLSVLFMRDTFDLKDAGFLASAIGAYQREQEREAQQAAQVDSDYIGTVGTRQLLEGLTLKDRKVWDGYYGATYFHKFLDMAGNVIVWKSSKCVGKVGDTLSLKATIKAHEPYKTTKQTVVTRCTLI